MHSAQGSTIIMYVRVGRPRVGYVGAFIRFHIGACMPLVEMYIVSVINNYIIYTYIRMYACNISL